ncbi:MAG: hypothetical protein ABSB91_01175 [Sedimentisphaerales bacterium]
MDNDYKIKLEVRGRASEFEAESVVELNYLFATELFRLDLLTSPANTKNNAEAEAKKLMEQYYQRFGNMNNNRSRSPIACAGLEVDLARLYLAKGTTGEAVNWLKRERNFKTSITAVGRYWKRFVSLPAAARTA